MYEARGIASHAFEREIDHERLWAFTERRLAVDKDDRLGIFLDAAVEQVGRAVILGRPEADYAAWLQRGLELALALFQGDSDDRTAPAWMKGFAISHILRNRDAALKLCANLPTPFPGEGELYDVYRAEIAHGLCAWETGEDWSAPLTDAYFRVRTPSQNPQFAKRVGWPTVDMLLAVHRRKPGAFNEALYAVLMGHREIYGDAENNWRAVGGIALVPLGICCIASDLGFPIEVESPYIPRWLIEP